MAEMSLVERCSFELIIHHDAICSTLSRSEPLLSLLMRSRLKSKVALRFKLNTYNEYSLVLDISGLWLIKEDKMDLVIK